MRRSLLFCVGSFFAFTACSKGNFVDDDAGPDGNIFNTDGGGETGLPACATGDYAIKHEPTAFLTLLQRSGSMGQANKWVFAAQAIVQALDQPVFDELYLGLMAAPSSAVTGPACLFNFSVACGVPAFPQIDLVLAGAKKSSDGGGVRFGIKGWLASNSPDVSLGEGNPLYNAMQAAIGSLQGWTKGTKRILFVVTDGGISCTSLSSRPGYTDGNGCTDWEYPSSIMTLVNQANQDKSAPVETFVVGVPGADTYDATGKAYPPYHMRAALSSIAHAGSPSFVPAGCTFTNPFNQSDPDPAPGKSCHFDMTSGYTASAVANAIQTVRGNVLGCLYDLPVPTSGTIDKALVNVYMRIAANPEAMLFKRANTSDTCTTDGCWDYNGDKVELVGKACTDVKAASDANVRIVVGCKTEVR